MRLTQTMMRLKKLAQNNMSRQYQYLWIVHKKKKLKCGGEKELLEAQGIKVHSARDIVSPVCHTPEYSDFFPPATPSPTQEALHLIDGRFEPVLGHAISLAQNLCHSVVSDQLPDSVLRRTRALHSDEQRFIAEDILSAHVLDGTLVRQRRQINTELPNKLEYRGYFFGIPMARKNQLLTSFLSQTFSNTSIDRFKCLDRYKSSHASVRCAFRYKGHLLQLDIPHARCLCGLSPLSPISPRGETDLFVPPEYDEKTKRKIMRKQMVPETGGPLQQPLPSVGVLHPFIGARQEGHYDAVDTEYVTDAVVYPHTVYLNHDKEILQLTYDQLTSLTMTALHAHALAFAVSRNVKINTMGHLERPIVVQGVHTHSNIVQPAVYQLNTIGPHCVPVVCGGAPSSHGDAEATALRLSGAPSSPTPDPRLNLEHAAEGAYMRNVFHYKPFSPLYQLCEYVKAKPTLQGVDMELVAVLRALHETGILDEE